MGYVIAKYLWLSLEDAKTDSMSISSQRMMLDRFIRGLGVAEAEVLEFVDNGYSGTNMERPGVQELLELVRAGRVDCIVVKDFSRFGRNVVDTGYFIERVFPLYRVRFVALSDSYDSDGNKDGIGGFDVSFRFLINELYSRDLSRKIKSAKARRQELGEAVTKNCAFGYRLDEGRNMVIDEAAAETVRLIFSLALEGISLAGIARRLYDDKIQIPSVQKKQKRGKTVETAYVWSKATLLQMLRDEQYTGVYVARKTEIVEVGSKKAVPVADSDWIRIPDHHPAIVSRADFEAVREALGTRGPRKSGRVLDTSHRYAENAASPLKGKVVCGACGHAMQIGVTKNPSFHCKFTHAAPDAVCHRLSIRKNELEDRVFAACREYAESLLLRAERNAAADTRPRAGRVGRKQHKAVV